MTLETFREIDRLGRSDDPALFSLSSPDRCASAHDIEAVQKKLKVLLPENYRTFLIQFGGGSYGLTTIFSADPQSEWYLPAKQIEARAYLPGNLLAFSDDFSGGMYVFIITDGIANENVFYWNPDGGLVNTDYTDVFDFVAKFAYKAA